MNNYISSFITPFGSYNMYKTYTILFDNEDLYKIVILNYIDEDHNLRNILAKTLLFMHVWYINNNIPLNENFVSYEDFFNHNFSVIFNLEKNPDELFLARKMFENLRKYYIFLGPYTTSFNNKIYKTKNVFNILFSLYCLYINV
jgi:hypothetical protein